MSEAPTGEANMSVKLADFVGSIDHGSITGLTDSADHAWATLIDGSRAFTGDQSMGGFGFTNVDDITAVSGNVLEFISTVADGAAAEGHRINWDANVSTPTDLAAMLTVGYTDNGDTYQKAFSFEQQGVNGPMLRMAAEYGSRAWLGFGASATPTTWIEFQSSLLRFRINSRNAFSITHSGGSTGVGQWQVVDGKQFIFTVSDTDVNTDSNPVWSFGITGSTGKTNGPVFNIDNIGVDLLTVGHLGDLITSAGRVAGATRITGNTTLDTTHHNVFADTDGGVFTVTLPAGVTGTTYRIINSGSTSNNLTITPNGAELLLGANSSFTLLDGEILVIVYETTEGWW